MEPCTEQEVKKGPKPQHPEVAAIGKILGVLEGVECPDAKARVLNYVGDVCGLSPRTEKTDSFTLVFPGVTSVAEVIPALAPDCFARVEEHADPAGPCCA